MEDHILKRPDRNLQLGKHSYLAFIHLYNGFFHEKTSFLLKSVQCIGLKMECIYLKAYAPHFEITCPL